MELKGIGQVGASIVLREVQMVWDEVFPFADARVFETARALHLPNDWNHLRQLVGIMTDLGWWQLWCGFAWTTARMTFSKRQGRGPAHTPLTSHT
jgi:hypothetical protein